MGGSFRRGLHSEVVTFSTRLAVQPPHLYKSNVRNARRQPPNFVSWLLMAQMDFILYSGTAVWPINYIYVSHNAFFWDSQA